MKICRVSLAQGSDLVLSTGAIGLQIPVFNDTDGSRAFFSRFGRVLRRVEVEADFTNLLAFGADLKIPKEEEEFSVASGRLELNGIDDTYNCIIVSFGIGQEFAFYHIHHEEDRQFFAIYSRIRVVSRFEVRVKA